MRQYSPQTEELRKQIRRIISSSREECMRHVKEDAARLFEALRDELMQNSSSQDAITSGIAGFSEKTLKDILQADKAAETLDSEDSSRVLIEYLDFDRLKIEAFRSRYPKAFARWTGEQDRRLLQMKEEGASLQQISQELQRNINAIAIRLEKLGHPDSGASPRARYPMTPRKSSSLTEEEAQGK